MSPLKQSHLRFPIRLGNFFSFIFALILFASCNTTDKKGGSDSTDNMVKPGTEKADAIETPNRWPFFKLDRNTLQTLIAEPDGPLSKSHGNKRIILKQTIENINNGDVTMRLWGFATKGHGEHGKNAIGFEIPKDERTPKGLENPVMLGNNYIDWSTIANCILQTVAGKYVIRADFAYILFEPMNTAPWPGHLWYKITIYDNNGGVINCQGGGGSGSSNPSPPAEPILP